MSDFSKISNRTKITAFLIVFSALYTALRIVPLGPMIGLSATFSVSDFLAPLYGIMLGPYVGGLSIFIGTFLGMAMGKAPVFMGLDFLPAFVNCVAIGFLIKRKLAPVIVLNIFLLLAFILNPLTTLFFGPVPFFWLHIVAFLVLISPLGRKAGKWVETLKPKTVTKQRPKLAVVISLIGGILGLIVGCILLLITLVVPDFFGLVLLWKVLFEAIGLLSLIGATIVIVAAMKLNSNPSENRKWGLVMMLFSIIGIGSLLSLVGGILALLYKPQTGASNEISAKSYAFLTAGIAILAFVGTMMQHLTGNLLTEVVLGQIVGSISPETFSTFIWPGAFLAYPVERTLLVVLSVIVGVPLVRALKISLLPLQKTSSQE